MTSDPQTPGAPWMPLTRRESHHESVRIWEHPTGASIMHAADGWYSRPEGATSVWRAVPSLDEDPVASACIRALQAVG